MPFFFFSFFFGCPSCLWAFCKSNFGTVFPSFGSNNIRPVFMGRYMRRTMEIAHYFWVLIKLISLYLLAFVIACLLAHDMLASMLYA